MCRVSHARARARTLARSNARALWRDIYAVVDVCVCVCMYLVALTELLLRCDNLATPWVRVAFALHRGLELPLRRGSEYFHHVVISSSFFVFSWRARALSLARSLARSLACAPSLAVWVHSSSMLGRGTDAQARGGDEHAISFPRPSAGTNSQKSAS